MTWLIYTTRIAKFFEHESCGKCAPSREGTMRMFDLMEKIIMVDAHRLMLHCSTNWAGKCLIPVSVVWARLLQHRCDTIKHFSADYNAKFV